LLVFGIDPGLTVTAFGVLRAAGSRLGFVASDALPTAPSTPMPERLLAIHRFLGRALAEHRPDAVAIEAIFRHRSSESALRLGHARGVAMLAAAEAGLPVHEYNAATVKRTAGGSGRADKEGLARMVRLLLGTVPDGPHDLTDALAIAITHAAHARGAR
jgi:crossover junction endodeoxyribonuclease RuvC